MDEPLHLSVATLLYVSSRAAGRTDLSLPERLSLAPSAGAAETWRYTGALPDGVECLLEGTLAHDTHLLRLTLQQPGPGPVSALQGLKSRAEALLQQAWQTPDAARPWAATIVYQLVLRGPVTAADLNACAAVLRPAAGPDQPQNGFETTPFGWLLLLGDSRSSIGAQPEIGLRELLLVTLDERAEQVRHFFTGPLTQGLARIELYLHKARHHAQQEMVVRRDLLHASTALQESLVRDLQTTDFSQVYREQQELEHISQRLMHFLIQKAYAEILLNSLKANIAAFESHLERVKLDSPGYNLARMTFSRQVEQLESDLHNAQVIADSTYTFQDIQRGVEANRLERASYLMGSTAALLAGIAIFNSFLDIWNLATEGSGILLPPAWLRIVLGFTAGVSWPLAAYGFVERRKRIAFIWTAIGIIVLLAAVLSTVIVNG